LPTLMAQCSLITQVFRNLIGNAVKFRGEKDPHVHVSAEERENHWVFHVVDNGIGIKADYQAKIFQIFQRLHNRSKYQGNGIGLAITKRIVEFHGGSISVSSEPGNGCTFTFEISKHLGEAGVKKSDSYTT